MLRAAWEIRRVGGRTEDWFFLLLGIGLCCYGAWVASRAVRLEEGAVVVRDGLAVTRMSVAEVAFIDIARVGDTGVPAHSQTVLRVPLAARLVCHDGRIVSVRALTADARTRRDPRRWDAYLDRVAELARHCGVPLDAA